MRKVLNKKMLLSIISGVLVTAVIIGAGTFAWFTSRDTAANGEFTTATVKITNTGNESKAFNFYTYDSNTFNFQKTKLEDQVNNPTELFNWLKAIYDASRPDVGFLGMTKAEYDALNTGLEALEDGVEDAYDAFKAALMAFHGEYALYAAANPGNIAANQQVVTLDLQIQLDHYKNTSNLPQANMWFTDGGYEDAFDFWGDVPASLYNALADAGIALDDYSNAVTALAAQRTNIAQAVIYQEIPANDYVTPGSFMLGNYAFENGSNIPVYFRLEDKSEVNSNVTVLVDINNSSIALTKIGGYWYCLTPVPANIDNIEIGVIAYIPGSVEGEAAMNQTLKFGGAEVEIIQVSNNAVTFYDADWAAALGFN